MTKDPSDDPKAQLSARRQVLAALPAILPALLAQSARAQNAPAVQPQSYKVVLENEYVRVLEFNSKPGMGVCGNGMHSHPAHLTASASP